MGKYGCRSAVWQKKFCAALMISFLIEGVYFLWGGNILPVWAEDESRLEIEFLGEETGNSKIKDAETNSQEPQELKQVETEPAETKLSTEENQKRGIAESSKSETAEADIQESKETESESAEAETSAAEIPETDIQESSVTETGIFEQKDTEEDSQSLKRTEPDSAETDTGETLATDIDKSNIAEPEDSQSEIFGDSTYKMLSDEETLELEGLACLQIPEKLEIIIDPLEIDERGQIYSEPFMVRNIGDAPGILTLSFTCRLNKADGVKIMETREKLHESRKKLIYMKAVFENGEEFIFTGEGTKCQAKLQPGDELSLWFEGEVNENAEESWEDNDVDIEGVYSWEEDIQSEKDEKNNSETEKETNGEETLPTEKEKEILGEETLPSEIEKESLSGEESQPTEEERESSREETLPIETEKESSSGEETMPSEKEAETSEEDFPPAELETEVNGEKETLPAETETETSKGEESLPSETETESVGENEEQILIDNGAGRENAEENNPLKNNSKEAKENDG